MLFRRLRCTRPRGSEVFEVVHEQRVGRVAVHLSAGRLDGSREWRRAAAEHAEHTRLKTEILCATTESKTREANPGQFLARVCVQLLSDTMKSQSNQQLLLFFMIVGAK